MTDSASVQVDSAATRNGCRGCERYRPPDSKRWSPRGLHCTTCHADYDHGACVQCGACLPAGHRYDRRYCSSSCRAAATRDRERERLERAAWEAEHPEEAAQQEANYQSLLAEFKAVVTSLDRRSDEVKVRDAQHRDARQRADRCADCQRPFADDDTIYRRFNDWWTGDGAIVVPVCAEHRCTLLLAEHRPYLCDRCRPSRGAWDWTTRTHLRVWTCPSAGPGHVEQYATYCHGCHPSAWREAEPCDGCRRPVANHITVRRGLRRGAVLDRYDDRIAWVPDDDHGCTDIAVEDVASTFCSEHCRRTVFQAERRAKRLAERGDPARQCATCKAEFKPARADARYCSPACRQRAYRRRKADR